jgi:hypothetical protein
MIKFPCDDNGGAVERGRWTGQEGRSEGFEAEMVGEEGKG